MPCVLCIVKIKFFLPFREVKSEAGENSVIFVVYKLDILGINQFELSYLFVTILPKQFLKYNSELQL